MVGRMAVMALVSTSALVAAQGRSNATDERALQTRVWVNTSSRVYHCPSSQYYGLTKSGEFMVEAQARGSGIRAAGGRGCNNETTSGPAPLPDTTSAARRMVWVNTESQVYHCPGSADYGLTRRGRYMQESDAATAGSKPAGGRACESREQSIDAARIRAAVDSIVGAALAGGRAAGMSVGVVRGKDTLVLKGYGMADLELDVPTPDRAIYEIGSVTKQFTSASILLLMEQGKLALDDPLTKYLPDYPTRGNTVTIRRLLDHTSGIAGYTEMPVFGPLMLQRLPRDTLVKIFSAAPFKFAPGEALAYNNSAYFLLGLIIEKASGVSYADFVKANLFDKVGMKDSRYCSEREVMKRKTHGYDFAMGRLVLKGYLDHTWPYAAGSLCSSAGDLIAWTQALHGGRVLSPASYRLQITPVPLNDGTPVRYAMGLLNDSIGGRHAIHHGGGINGFLSDLAYFPDDQLIITVLVNSAGPVAPGAITSAIADLIHGRPAAPVAVALDHPAADYAGTFRGIGRADSITATITDSAGVRIRMGGPQSAAISPRYIGRDRFMVGRQILSFKRENGRVTSFTADQLSVVSTLRRIR